MIEVHYAGNKAKDYTASVERYACLGIHEYFIYDRLHPSLRGYRLSLPEEGQAGKRRVYRPILPQGGLFSSRVLGLDLTIEGSRLRFFYGMAPVPEAEELIGVDENPRKRRLERTRQISDGSTMLLDMLVLLIAGASAIISRH